MAEEILHSAFKYAQCNEIKELWGKNAFKAVANQAILLEDITCKKCIRKIIWYLDSKLKTK